MDHGAGAETPMRVRILRATFKVLCRGRDDLVERLRPAGPLAETRLHTPRFLFVELFKHKYVAGICAYKHHLTFAPWSPRVIEDFKVRLGKFVVWKNCFQIPIDWEINRELVKELVRARLAELDLPKTAQL